MKNYLVIIFLFVALFSCENEATKPEITPSVIPFDTKLIIDTKWELVGKQYKNKNPIEHGYFKPYETDTLLFRMDGTYRRSRNNRSEEGIYETMTSTITLWCYGIPRIYHMEFISTDTMNLSDLGEESTDYWYKYAKIE